MENHLTNTEIKIASRKRRIAAFIIDHFILSSVSVLSVFAFMSGSIDTAQADGFGDFMLFSVVLIMLVYFAKDSFGGASIGKRFLGIAVRDENDKTQTPSFNRLFIRNIPVAIWFVEFIVLAASPAKQRLGDMWAKTVVVRKPSKVKLGYIIATGVLVFVSIIALTFFVLISTFKSSEAYKTAISGIESNENIVKETGGITGYGPFPLGSLQYTNNSGSADFRIKVYGKKKDMLIAVFLFKNETTPWQISKMEKLE